MCLLGPDEPQELKHQEGVITIHQCTHLYRNIVCVLTHRRKPLHSYPVSGVWQDK